MVIKTDETKPLLIMMVGLPGSGKSSLSEKIVVERNGETTKPLIHSSDALREEWYGDANFQGDEKHRGEENAKRVTEMKKRMLADMERGHDVIYDATNISKRRRSGFFREICKADCHKICVCVMTPFDVCLERNKDRAERVVPYDSMRKMYLNWNPPNYGEGFDEIIPVFDYGSEQNREKYSQKGLVELFKKIDAVDQGSKHHALTLGHHCRAAAQYIDRAVQESETYTKDPQRAKNLQIASILHDIGKLYTRTKSDDGQCHYYQHHCVGAYESMFYLDSAKSDLSLQDKLDVANLIYYHMKPFMTWKQSQKSVNRDKNVMGQDMYDDVMLLHKADRYAHDNVLEIKDKIIIEGDIEIER